MCACLTLAVGIHTPGRTRAEPPQAPQTGKTAVPEASDGSESYEALLDRAVEAFEASDFGRAHELFSRAYDLRPNARLLRGMGVAALRLERYSEAYRILRRSLEHPAQPLTSEQRDEVNELLSWMETKLANVRLRWSPSEPADYELLVDDVVLKESSLWLSPGTHHVAIHARGFGALERSLTLEAEQHEVINLSLSQREAATPPAPPVSPSQVARALPSDARATKAGQRGARHTQPPGVATTSDAARSHKADADANNEGGVLTRWWFWTALGAVAAGSVTAAVLLSTPAPTQPPDTSGGAVLLEVPASRIRP